MNNTVNFLIELAAIIMSIITLVTGYFATKEVNQIVKERNSDNKGNIYQSNQQGKVLLEKH